MATVVEAPVHKSILKPASGMQPEKVCTSQLDSAHAPGHWVLAQLGKKVLRPGGLEATRILLRQMNITTADDVVEFAPGLGLTAKMILEHSPASYTAVERDDAAVERLRKSLPADCAISHGAAEASELDHQSASHVIGEAMLTMHPVQTKCAIMSEAARLLKPGGFYGIHEMVLRSDNTPQPVRRELCRMMSKSIHHGVTPLSTTEWLALLDEHGFVPVCVEYVPFKLLNPLRIIADEGFAGALKFALNVARNKPARRRVLNMRQVFRQYRQHLSAIVIIARKK